MKLERENDNLRSALEWSLLETDGRVNALRLVTALNWFWYVRGHYAEGREWLEKALDTSDVKPSSMRSKALTAAGSVARLQGESERARALFEASLQISRELGDRPEIVRALHNLARLAHTSGNYAEAMTRYDECLGLQRELIDKWGIAWTLLNSPYAVWAIEARVMGG